jgi:hypothetical protein
MTASKLEQIPYPTTTVTVPYLLLSTLASILILFCFCLFFHFRPKSSLTHTNTYKIPKLQEEEEEEEKLAQKELSSPTFVQKLPHFFLNDDFLYSSPSKLRGSNSHLHHQQQKQEQTPIKLFATLQPQHPNTTISLLFSFNPRKESPFPKTLIYVRLLQYLFSDFFFGN